IQIKGNRFSLFTALDDFANFVNDGIDLEALLLVIFDVLELANEVADVITKWGGDVRATFSVCAAELFSQSLTRFSITSVKFSTFDKTMLLSVDVSVAQIEFCNNIFEHMGSTFDANVSGLVACKLGIRFIDETKGFDEHLPNLFKNGIHGFISIMFPGSLSLF
ncbi:AAEL017057-PA, partial [Aedes aegypti]